METCDCKNGHTDQREKFPLNADVIALCAMPCSQFPQHNVSVGEMGRVADHCADGRACIRFANGSVHTFHFPDGYIKRL